MQEERKTIQRYIFKCFSLLAHLMSIAFFVCISVSVCSPFYRWRTNLKPSNNSYVITDDAILTNLHSKWLDKESSTDMFQLLIRDIQFLTYIYSSTIAFALLNCLPSLLKYARCTHFSYLTYLVIHTMFNPFSSYLYNCELPAYIFPANIKQKVELNYINFVSQRRFPQTLISIFLSWLIENFPTFNINYQLSNMLLQ